MITRDAEGVVRETEYSDGETYVFTSENGLLETAYEEPGTENHDRFDYTFDTSNLIPPKTWSGQTGQQIRLDKDGVEQERLGFFYRTRGLGEIAIGDCIYETVAVQTYYDNPDGRSLVEFVYLLDLGIPLAIGFGGPGYFDPYIPQRISAID